MEADAFVVIDVLRATTTIATMFEQGLDDLLVLDDLAAARARAAAEQRLLFGEVGGLPPEGFDYGNSPVEAGALQLRGQRAALFTTNGTRALCGVAGRGVVATAAFANLTAAGHWAAAFARVVLVCAGESSGTRFAPRRFRHGCGDGPSAETREPRGSCSGMRPEWQPPSPATKT